MAANVGGAWTANSAISCCHSPTCVRAPEMIHRVRSILPNQNFVALGIRGPNFVDATRTVVSFVYSSCLVSKRENIYSDLWFCSS